MQSLSNYKYSIIIRPFQKKYFALVKPESQNIMRVKSFHLQQSTGLHKPSSYVIHSYTNTFYTSIHGILQGKNTGVGCHFLLQDLYGTQYKLSLRYTDLEEKRHG